MSSPTTAAARQSAPLRQLVIKLALSLTIAIAFLALLHDRMGHVDTTQIAATLSSLPTALWATACAATAISFWAVGQYDITLHRHLATHVPTAQARRAGITAIALSQTIGAGVITGALVRWRCLPGIGLWQATLLSAAVALSFLAGWAVVTSLVLLISPLPHMTIPAAITLTIALAAAVICTLQPHALRRFSLPNLITLSRILVWAAIDTIAAALALWLLLPADVAFLTLLPAFLIALGAGLISGAPAGLGAFEVTLLALLPQVPDTTLLAAVLGWRIVYFALPAMIAAAAALRPPRFAAILPALRPASAHDTQNLLAAAPRAETALVRQGQMTLLQGTSGAWLTGQTPNTLTALFDPIGPAILADLTAQAHATARLPALYKASPRTAAMARKLGWHAIPLGAEALLCPLSFSVNTPAHATLRRKLRKAAAANIDICLLTAADIPTVAASARLWQGHRRQRGFSMGQLDASFQATQRVYAATCKGQTIALISLHEGPQEWTLDLMRHSPLAPDGTMHALIMQALHDAHKAAIPRLSLAAAGAPRALPHPLRALADRHAAGLLQFKQTFAPRWQPLYLCAPTRTALMIAAAEITRAIHWPAPIPAQDHHVQYGFAPAPHAWQRGAAHIH